MNGHGLRRFAEDLHYVLTPRAAFLGAVVLVASVSIGYLVGANVWGLL